MFLLRVLYLRVWVRSWVQTLSVFSFEKCCIWCLFSKFLICFLPVLITGSTTKYIRVHNTWYYMVIPEINRYVSRKERNRLFFSNSHIVWYHQSSRNKKGAIQCWSHTFNLLITTQVIIWNHTKIIFTVLSSNSGLKWNGVDPLIDYFVFYLVWKKHILFGVIYDRDWDM